MNVDLEGLVQKKKVLYVSILNQESGNERLWNMEDKENTKKY